MKKAYIDQDPCIIITSDGTLELEEFYDNIHEELAIKNNIEYLNHLLKKIDDCIATNTEKQNNRIGKVIGNGFIASTLIALGYDSVAFHRVKDAHQSNCLAHAFIIHLLVASLGVATSLGTNRRFSAREQKIKKLQECRAICLSEKQYQENLLSSLESSKDPQKKELSLNDLMIVSLAGDLEEYKQELNRSIKNKFALEEKRKLKKIFK